MLSSPRELFSARPALDTIEKVTAVVCKTLFFDRKSENLSFVWKFFGFFAIFFRSSAILSLPFKSLRELADVCTNLQNSRLSTPRLRNDPYRVSSQTRERSLISSEPPHMLLAFELTQLAKKSRNSCTNAHTQPADGADMLPWRGCVCLRVFRTVKQRPRRENKCQRELELLFSSVMSSMGCDCEIGVQALAPRAAYQPCSANLVAIDT